MAAVQGAEDVYASVSSDLCFVWAEAADAPTRETINPARGLKHTGKC
jgi:hypothetical protein